MATIDNNYNVMFNGFKGVAERIEELQGEIFENMEPSEFKDYLLYELSMLKIRQLDMMQGFNEEYCQDSQVKQYNEDKLQDKINAINESINRDGLSL